MGRHEPPGAGDRPKRCRDADPRRAAPARRLEPAPGVLRDTAERAPYGELPEALEAAGVVSAEELPERYLSRSGVAELLGVKPDTLNRYKLPEPDVMLGGRRGWLPETIDEWQASRPGRGRWGKRPSAAEVEHLAVAEELGNKQAREAAEREAGI